MWVEDLMTTARTIAKNTTVLFIAQIITYVIGFFITMYTARYLGAEGFGVISLALSITGIFGIISDMGLSTLMVRDIAREKSLKDKYLINVSLMKLILVFLMSGSIILFVSVIGYDFTAKTVIYIITISTLINAFAGVFAAVFQANEKMEYISINSIINSAAMLLGTVIGITYQLDIFYFALLYVISNVLSLIYILIIYVWKFSIPKSKIDFTFWKPTINEAWPFGVTSFFVNIYYWIDSVILSIMVSAEVVGWYNAAYRLIMVLLFIPIVLNTVMFPVMSKYYVSSKDSFRLLYDKYFQYMVIIGIPIGVGTTLLADKIILLIYGSQYTPSITALQILIWANVIIFVSGAFGRLLEVSNKQLVLTKITAICAVANIIFNIILIPKFSYVGASIVTVLTELASLLLGLRVVSKMGYVPSRKQLSFTIKSILASVVMGIFIIMFKELNLLLLIFGGCVTYFLILFLIKGFDDNDIIIIKRIFGKEE